MFISPQSLRGRVAGYVSLKLKSQTSVLLTLCSMADAFSLIFADV